MKLPDYIISPAEMGKLMFENFGDYTYVITKLKEISFQQNDKIQNMQGFKKHTQNITIKLSTVSNNSNETQPIDIKNEVAGLIKCSSYSDIEYERLKTLELRKTFNELQEQKDNSKGPTNTETIATMLKAWDIDGSRYNHNYLGSIDPNDKYHFADYNTI